MLLRVEADVKRTKTAFHMTFSCRRMALRNLVNVRPR